MSNAFQLLLNFTKMAQTAKQKTQSAIIQQAVTSG